ncbi:MAG: DEAD/DEAH box helicase [Actinomycetota bacterium]|nr:DEAD/DEAH box helicase [Actinomycetota bacterium]
MHTLDPSRAAARAAGFAELGVPQPIVRALARTGIDDPRPIQAATIPDSLAGRDVLGRAKTGSGKTIAFGVPVVAALAASGRTRPGRPRALVLVPTRELATQVAAAITPLAKAMSLSCTTAFGGVGQGRQVAALRGGVDILIACPGRLEDLIGQRHCSLGDVMVTVLDEADHMADLGFLPAVRRLLDLTPAGGQRMLFSATLDGAVAGLVRRHTTNAVTHELDTEPDEAPLIDHHVLSIAAADKRAIIHDLAASSDRTLLFTRTKHGARKLARQLTTSGIPAVDLHGNLSQGARERNLESFSRGSSPVLVATDIAARGIHVDDISLVVHVDPPAEHKAYLHRSGRTARSGARGVVVTLATPEQSRDVQRMTKAAGITPTATAVRPGDRFLSQLAGGPDDATRRNPPRTNVAPAPAATYSPSTTTVTSAPRRGRDDRRDGRSRDDRRENRSPRVDRSGRVGSDRRNGSDRRVSDQRPNGDQRPVGDRRDGSEGGRDRPDRDTRSRRGGRNRNGRSRSRARAPR